MENAVDAGATKVQVIVTDGGRTLIQVVDNGKGMSETDARLAFERHATSKISCAEDLFALSTMGFRGEALASLQLRRWNWLRVGPMMNWVHKSSYPVRSWSYRNLSRPPVAAISRSRTCFSIYRRAVSS